MQRKTQHTLAPRRGRARSTSARSNRHHADQRRLQPQKPPSVLWRRANARTIGSVPPPISPPSSSMSRALALVDSSDESRKFERASVSGSVLERSEEHTSELQS